MRSDAQAKLLRVIEEKRSSRFFCASVKRARMLRKSELSNVVFSSIFPVGKPLPKG